MICSSVCPFLGILPPSAFVQRTTSGCRTQPPSCLIFGFWVTSRRCDSSCSAVPVHRPASSAKCNWHPPEPSFGHQFADVLVRERIAEIPTHAQDNHFS